jgi:hypothetical protein
MTVGTKKSFFSVLVFVCAFSLSKAQTDTIQQRLEEKYIPETFCMNMQDGIAVLMADGQPVTADIALKSGMRITAGGKVIKADGTELVLRDRDCINSSGQIIKAQGRQPIEKKSRRN